jgi:glutamate-1-semialdehyde 2,1-aminomutase
VVQAVQQRVASGTHFAQPTEDCYVVAEALRERFGMPMWRFTNSGTEATMDAFHLMRAITGRKLVVKIEGTYHGHHDAAMVSIYRSLDMLGPEDEPYRVPGSGVPQEMAELLRIVPFNDLAALERVFERHPGQVAGMILEPMMMNAGIIPPSPGYLEGARDIAHRHGALIAFDEVKTGLVVHPGGVTRLFGVQPDIVCLAKALGGGLPCGAIGGTAEVMQAIEDGRYDQVGTFNGNPLTMAAMKSTLTEVLTRDAYAELDRVGAEFARCDEVIERYRLDASLKLLGAKGSIDWRAEPIHEYRDLWGIDDRVPQLAWLWQLNRGVFKSPGSKWESWTSSIVHSDEDVARYVDNFEELAAAITA